MGLGLLWGKTWQANLTPSIVHGLITPLDPNGHLTRGQRLASSCATPRCCSGLLRSRKQTCQETLWVGIFQR
eukprot:1393923-Amphidinium_carterae.1